MGSGFDSQQSDQLLLMKETLRIGVLMGGPSVEHDVSLNTGNNVMRALANKGYRHDPLILSSTKELSVHDKAVSFPNDMKHYDIIFNALHGTFGEDGELQTILDMLGISYTGSGAEASALGMDKWKSREIFKKTGLSVPASQILQRSDIIPAISFPAIVKPRASGSSQGVHIVATEKELREKCSNIFTQGSDIIIEEYLQGREFTCGVLEKDGVLIALPVVEIRPATAHAFFDYTAKYTDGGATEMIVSAPIDTDLTERIQRAAHTAHTALGCRVYSRSDFIVVDDVPYILEINTLPGLTAHSLLPKSAAAAGISFADLIELILTSSLAHFSR